MTGPPPVLLASNSISGRPRLAGTFWMGAGNRAGRVVGRLPGGGWRRAEQGPEGPLLLEVRPTETTIELQVWGPVGTPPDVAAQALVDTRRWAGLEDDLTGFAEALGPHPILRRVLRQLGPPIIGALPRVAESFGRAVLGQLVQGQEATRSAAQLVAMLGTATPQGVWAYPTRQALGAAQAHQLRRCGIALRSAGALHRFAVDEPALQQLGAGRAWEGLDSRLRRLPGVGVWTSAETRLYLGDADAISYGDYHLPHIVGWAIGERTETDEAMGELLAPFTPHRGRVIKLLEGAARRGLVDAKPRRAARAALSAHRYW
ncbi:DNA-3-methyladenine glycosylase [soil metagenome]